MSTTTEPEPPVPAAFADVTPPKGGFRAWRIGLGAFGLFPLVMLFAFNMFEGFDRVAFGALSPEIRDAFHLSDPQYVAITTFSTILPIFLSPFVGYLADLTNRVRLTQGAVAIYVITSVFIGA